MDTLEPCNTVNKHSTHRGLTGVEVGSIGATSSFYDSAGENCVIVSGVSFLIDGIQYSAREAMRSKSTKIQDAKHADESIEAWTVAMESIERKRHIQDGESCKMLHHMDQLYSESTNGHGKSISESTSKTCKKI